MTDHMDHDPVVDNILNDACLDAICVFRFGDRIHRRVPAGAVALSLQLAVGEAAQYMAEAAS